MMCRNVTDIALNGSGIIRLKVCIKANLSKESNDVEKSELEKATCAAEQSPVKLLYDNTFQSSFRQRATRS
jgi:hypothetical protein